MTTAPRAAIEASRARSVCAAVVGLQWGDEGKGKIVDRLAAEHDVVVRYNGGANAGHSVVVGGERYALHLVPSGVLHPGCRAVIGNGVVVDPERLLEEIASLSAKGVDVSRLYVSDRAHVVLPYHKAEDGLREDLLKAGRVGVRVGAGVSQEIGTTRRGIGPAYADKVTRATGIRVADLLRPDALRPKLDIACRMKNALFEGLAAAEKLEWRRFDPAELESQALDWGKKLAPMITDTTQLLHEAIGRGERVLFEGANATLLDVDHGTYPFVTSSNSSLAGVASGSGVPGHWMGRVTGVMKAYSTRVGAGPMPTQLDDATGDRIRERGREYGTTTGRPQRVGWLDLVAVRYSAMVSGVSEIALMLLDVLAGLDELKVCTAYRIDGQITDIFPPDGTSLESVEPIYETLPGFDDSVADSRADGDLPPNAAAYARFVADYVGVPVTTVSVGPEREQTVMLRREGAPA